jgi:alpha-1,3-mannosylglycoprotein beta-1,4-N-acetylglucosaminyltransferase A/B
MIKCSDLPWLIQFIVMFYNDKPGDWLLDELVKTKVCHLEKDQVSKLLIVLIRINLYL